MGMKNAAMILNAVLLVLVAILFYLHFSSKEKPKEAVVKSSQTQKTFNNDFRIAYFEMDSIENSFAMVKDVKSELSREEDKIKSENARLQKLYADKYNQYQGQQLSQVQSEAASKDMMELQDRIRGQQQEMDQKYQDLYMRKMRDVKIKIEEFLKEYNKTKGYSYIFSYEPGFIFYRDTTYNITSDLIKGLNGQYKKK
jgi:outer membrane protein